MECAYYDKFTAYPQKMREWNAMLSRIGCEFLDRPVFGGSLTTRTRKRGAGCNPSLTGLLL